MNDYNRGALPVPCLRLDYGFGDEWASVELGDGTGYIKLSEYDRLREMTGSTEAPRYDGMEYEELVVAAEFLWIENAKLRELVVRMRPICIEGKRCTFSDRIYVNSTMEELGIEV